MPITHDDFIKQLRYDPVYKGKYRGYNSRVARDLPEELRVGLTAWRKQTPDRISVKRYADLRYFSDGFFNPIADGDIAWEEIKAIEPGAEVQTYDLVIENNGSFFAEGVCTRSGLLADPDHAEPSPIKAA